MQTKHIIYTAEPIFDVVCELVQKLLAYCYKQLSSGDANYRYLSSIVVGALSNVVTNALYSYTVGHKKHTKIFFIIT